MTTTDTPLDPAQDLTSPMILGAGGVKPGMAVIHEDTQTVHIALNVTVRDGRAVLTFIGGSVWTLPEREPVLITRLSAMATYHARIPLRDAINQLCSLVEQWEQAAGSLDKTRDRAYQDGDEIITERADAGVTWLKGCAAEVRAILARIQP